MIALFHLPFTIDRLALIDHWSLIIVNSLKIDNYKLIIASEGGL